MRKSESSAVLEAALRRLVRKPEGLARDAKPAEAPTGAPPRTSSPVLAAALRRLTRDGRELGRAVREPAPSRRQPVVTLEPPRKPVDARALASLLADDAAKKLDQLCYVWSVIQELEPFASAGEQSPRRRAAELLLAAAGGDFEIPLEGPLRAVRAFLGAHGMQEEYVESLCAWYLDRAEGRRR